MEKPRTFALLDGLRGIAALAVVLFHYPDILGRGVFLHGYLAVDFFFVLSGFVLTFAYQTKLDGGWSTKEFMATRVARLYPLYAAGLMLGFLFTRVQTYYGVAQPSASILTLQLGFGLMIIPSGWGDSALFPFNMPAWSVFFELIANLMHACFLRRRSWVLLVSLMAFSAVGMLVGAVKLGTMDVGGHRPRAIWAIFRVLFSYTAGILLFRIWQRGWVRLRLPTFVILSILLFVFIAPIHGRAGTPFDLISVFFVLPTLVLCGASIKPTRHLVICYGALGRASYAIYVLQEPLYRFFNRMWAHTRVHSVGQDSPLAGFVYLALLVGASLLMDRLYDYAARERLRRMLLRTR